MLDGALWELSARGHVADGEHVAWAGRDELSPMETRGLLTGGGGGGTE